MVSPASSAGRRPQPVQPLESVAAASDFGNGIAAVLDWDEHMFINPDLTIYVERPPVDEWVALESQTRIEAGSVGWSRACCGTGAAASATRSSRW